MTIKMIFHSDDFGLHPAVNRAVLEAARQGVLTSASLMMNGHAVAEAVEGTKNNPRLGVGVHLNIVRGRPLSNPSEIPSLVDPETGLFFNSMSKLMMRSCLCKIAVMDVYREYRRQIQCFLDAGLSPTHFDGEKHSHILIPQAARALKKICEEFGVFKVRKIRETPALKFLSRRGIHLDHAVTQRLKLSLLEFFTRRMETHWTRLISTDMTFGVTMSGNIRYPQSLTIFENLLHLSGSRTLEWMFHIGYPFDACDAGFQQEFGRFFLNEARYEEFQFLTSDEMLRAVSDLGPRMINYKDLEM